MNTICNSAMQNNLKSTNDLDLLIKDFEEAELLSCNDGSKYFLVELLISIFKFHTEEAKLITITPLNPITNSEGPLLLLASTKNIHTLINILNRYIIRDFKLDIKYDIFNEDKYKIKLVGSTLYESGEVYAITFKATNLSKDRIEMDEVFKKFKVLDLYENTYSEQVCDTVISSWLSLCGKG